MKELNPRLPRGIRVLVSGAVDVYKAQSKKPAAAGKKGARVLEFCECLGRALASAGGDVPPVIITGGRGLPRSADRAVVHGAREVLKPDEVADRIVTFPAPERESPLDPVFAGTRIIRPRGRTRQARRFEMVRAADIVVSVAGRVGSPESIRLAEALEIPALPLLFTGGKSASMKREAERFGIEAKTIDKWSQAAEEPDADLTPYTARVVQEVLRRAVLPCFVAMPYGDEAVERLYEEAILPGITDAGFRAIRSDEESRPGMIVTQMLDSIRATGAMIGLLSDDRYRRLDPGGESGRAAVNPNVMYEVGFARALNIPSVLLAREAGSLPFDLRVDRTIGYGDLSPEEIRASIAKALRAVRTPLS